MSQFYPDCDGDGVFSNVPIRACDSTGANVKFNCHDGENPDGGWSSTAGNDCSDEDPSGTTAANWYPDCDGDGVHANAATNACGTAGADAAFSCQDGENPDGGWSSTAGTDCDDENVSATSASNWYPDCDGDGEFSSMATNACGTAGADAAFNCQDGGHPDGGWSGTPGTDCDDDSGDSTCWLDSGWLYRRKITLLGSRVSGTQQYFPVLISETRNKLKGLSQGGHVAQNDGGDIVFTDDDGITRLDHEIEIYNPNTGKLVAWVKVPIISSLYDTVIYIYHGNSSAGLGNQWNKNAVWDDGGNKYFKGVWHMAETGTGSRYDSTQYANHCSPQGYDGDESAAGKIARADQLDGNNDMLNCGRNSSLNIRDTVTVSSWIKPLSPRIPKDKWDDGPWKTSYGFYLYGTSDTTTTLGADFMISGKRKDIWDKGTIDISPGSWHYLVVTYDGSNLRAFVNGVRDYTVSMAGTIDDSSGTNLTVSLIEGADKGALKGLVDEIRVSRTKRSGNWISTCYRNQNSPSSFYTVGSEVQQ